MLKNIKAAIFDLDGTLVDSMWVWEQIDIDFLSSKGIEMPKNLKEEINHLSFQQTAHYFKERFSLKESPEELMDIWHNMAYDHYCKDIKLKDGVFEYLSYLKSKNIKIGLATSNSIPLLTAALKSNNIMYFFDEISITNEVSTGKNNPDIYLLSAKKLGVSPEECIVFEDIIEAVNGAKKANMFVVAIYDKCAEHQKESLIAKADKYIMSFNDLLNTNS